MIKFVYVPHFKGPQPVIWHRGFHTRDMKPIQPLQAHEITPEESEMTLDALAAKYPLKLEAK